MNRTRAVQAEASTTAQPATQQASSAGAGAGRIIKLVAIPAEHGGWGFLLEAVLLGLLVAPSVAGVFLGSAAIGVFLIRHPLELVVGDRRKGKRYPRTIWAERFVLLYCAVAFLGLGLAILTSAHAFWLPVVLAAPVALVQFYFDLIRQGRGAAAELAGAVALGAAASAIAMAGGSALGASLALWAILAVRSVTSIVYVRARLRLERGGDVDKTPAWILHAAALLLVLVLVYLGLLPWLALVVVGALTVRAAWGLSPYRRRVRAQVIGIGEMLYGIMTVLLVALGHWLAL